MTSQVSVCGLRIAVDVRGSGQPVLLINGLGGSLGLWEPLRRDLADLEVISFDAPGAGRSTTPRKMYTMSDLARFVTRLLDTLGYDTVDVVGHSFGGALAQQLAHQAPDRIRRIVLATTTCGWGGVPGTLGSAVTALTPFRLWSKRVYRLTIPLLAGGHNDEAELLRAWAGERLSKRPSFGGYSKQLLAGWTWSSLPWLTTIEHPVLVVAGSDDRLLPLANSQILATHLPNARMLVFEGHGHYLLLDQQSGASAAIGDFIRSSDLNESQTWRTAHVVSPDDLDDSLRSQKRWSPIAMPHTLLRHRWQSSTRY
ncbi:alpha/beta fold hydrolase [Nocardia xishanensis]|uniref:alpha/beta fold hydrolase n=1 Tax=Nocardia xishanensis TaxID=238964 RepID=UPI0009FE81C5|nr:alpha/beta hydrolase [Nocardia xishanensis]